MKHFCLIIFSALLLASCAVDTECRQDIKVLLGAQMAGDSLRLSADSTTLEHTTFTSVRGMSVRGLGRDSLLQESNLSFSSLRLPLRKDADTTGFILDYCGLEDTLMLRYTRQDTYVSLACGCAVFATLDSVWCTFPQFIDSLDVLNTAVSTAKENHLKIYFHKPL